MRVTENIPKQERKPGLCLAVVIISLSLAMGIGIAVSPRSVQAWILTIGAVPVTLAAMAKFAAFAALARRRKAFIPAALWGVMSCLFFLMLLADVRYLYERILAAG